MDLNTLKMYLEKRIETLGSHKITDVRHAMYDAGVISELEFILSLISKED